VQTNRHRCTAPLIVESLINESGNGSEKGISMKRVSRNLLVLCVAAAATFGCATREQTGQVIGGVAGAAAGTQVGGGSGRTAATIGGALIGAFVGGQVGSRMDEKDYQQTSMALENSQTGQSTQWVNPDSGNQYSIQPTRTYQADSGPCRDYTMAAVIDGRNETVTGTACRQADGTWR
jgi:surface antigen